MTEPLSNANVQIRTATVEIQVVKVSGKQMTQAVFKQLPYRRDWQDIRDLGGTIWGWVNYWPVPDTISERRRAVVFEARSKLYTTLLPSNDRIEEYEKSVARGEAMDRLLDWANTEFPDEKFEYKNNSIQRKWNYRTQDAADVISAKLSDKMSVLWQEEYDKRYQWVVIGKAFNAEATLRGQLFISV